MGRAVGALSLHRSPRFIVGSTGALEDEDEDEDEMALYRELALARLTGWFGTGGNQTSEH